MILSDGNETKECDVWEKDDRIVVVIVGNKTFEFDLPDEEIIKLVGNPYHDSKGRFSSGHAVAIGAGITAASIIASTITATKIENKATKIAKEKGISQSEARQRVLKQKVFSTKIGKKDISINYRQVEKAGKIVTIAGYVGTLVATNIWLSSQYDKGYERYRQKQENHYKRNKASWPKGASEDDFKSMYRKLAKKTHPDLGGKTEDFIKVDDFYKNKDWSGLKSLFDSAGLELELTDEEAQAFGLLISILFEGIKDGSELISFPLPEGVDEAPPFVIGEDEGKKYLVIDKWTAALIVGTVMDNFDELDRYLGEEDEGTDRPESSEE